MTDNLKEMTQAHVTAQQYADLQNYLAQLKQERKYETHLLVKMVIANLVFGWFFYQILTDGPQPMSSVSATIASCWIGCIPSGIMGLKRRRDDKGYFVFGTLLFFLFLYMLYAIVSIFTGVFSFIAQILRVIKVNKEIPLASKQVDRYRNAIYS